MIQYLHTSCTTQHKWISLSTRTAVANSRDSIAPLDFKLLIIQIKNWKGERNVRQVSSPAEIMQGAGDPCYKWNVNISRSSVSPTFNIFYSSHPSVRTFPTILSHLTNPHITLSPYIFDFTAPSLPPPRTPTQSWNSPPSHFSPSPPPHRAG